MDASRLRELLARLDAALERATVLDLHGGAAVLLLGMTGRTTLDIDVLPASTFDEISLRRACDVAGLLYEPTADEGLEREYLEVIPEQTLVLPAPSAQRPYNTVFRGERLTVRTPPAADLVAGKLKRLAADDLADVAFLIERYAVTTSELEEAFARLPARLQHDPVIADNLRYVIEDHLGAR